MYCYLPSWSRMNLLAMVMNLWIMVMMNSLRLYTCVDDKGYFHEREDEQRFAPLMGGTECLP